MCIIIIATYLPTNSFGWLSSCSAQILKDKKKYDYLRDANGLKEGVTQSSDSTDVMDSVNITTIFGPDDK